MSSLTLKTLDVQCPTDVPKDYQCLTCNGKGVFQKMTWVKERERGISYRCRGCLGSGKGSIHNGTLSEVPFTGLQVDNTIKFVCIQPEDGHIPFGTDGIPYPEFLKGRLPEPRLEVQDA